MSEHQPPKSPKFSFTIDRSRWARGKPEHGTSNWLRCTDGAQCCLGLFLSACGVPDDELTEIGEPNDVAHDRHHMRKETLPGRAKWLVCCEPDPEADEWNDETGFTPSEATCRLIDVNDNETLTEPEREAQVREWFALHGIDVAFVDADSAGAKR